MSVLEITGVSAGYGRTAVVSEVSLKAKVGQIVSIVGPNGAGKSTLLKALFGLIDVTAGSVKLDGVEVVSWPTHQLARAGISYVPQVENIFPSLSIRENLEVGGFFRKGELEDRIHQVFSIFPDLKHGPDRKASDLSGGQRNMLGMARALMSDPKIILLDEPTAGLSPRYVEVVWELVDAIASTGTSVVIVEQSVERSVRFSEWVYVMISGRNLMDGPAEVIGRRNLAEIFLGAPSISARL
ncbi:MAG: ABC transporter ATP-binding protein [Acidimicrobiales bacterium]